eukprot:CAMPEP_0171459862 /NCGR_PEP_ID=MMETSP0945-20130129/4967_1 /TAXON_ID=109269 /ORGANISM="Vaucheria litorea, Strain CCMP2940" /LENGTH=138 /DNA_ID=CAMNT_0011985947 /DNA_START=483 /DNA_END=895 /DNA_ORIENTATION=+
MTEFQPEFNKAITLLGFSKGAMVLNQLISELSVKLSPFQCESGSDSDYTSSDSEPDEPYSNILFKRVKAIHFLDPGNGPLKGSWVLNHRAIASLVKFPIKMYIHGTIWPKSTSGQMKGASLCTSNYWKISSLAMGKHG